MTIKFSAPIEPVPFKRVMSNGRQRFNDKRYSDFKDALGYVARVAMHGRAPLAGAIKISVEVCKKIIPTALNFGDWDNHAKAVSDALNGICFLDDKQIVEGHVKLFKGNPHVTVELEELS